MLEEWRAIEDVALARGFRAAGLAVMLGAMAWAAVILRTQYLKSRNRG